MRAAGCAGAVHRIGEAAGQWLRNIPLDQPCPGASGCTHASSRHKNGEPCPQRAKDRPFPRMILAMRNRPAGTSRVTSALLAFQMISFFPRSTRRTLALNRPIRGAARRRLGANRRSTDDDATTGRHQCLPSSESRSARSRNLPLCKQPRRALRVCPDALPERGFTASHTATWKAPGYRTPPKKSGA